MDAKRLMKRDEETYANLLPGLKYDIGEAVDRVKLMEQGNAPFHEPRDYLCWTWIVSMTPEEIATQRRLITKHEAAFAASTEWCVNVKENDLYQLPDDVQTDFLRHLCGVEEGEEDHANLQGIVMAGPDRVEGKSPVSGPGQGSDGKAWEWMERRERVKERWYEAWAEVDQAYADFYKAFVELYRARVQHAKARAEFCEWLRQKPAAVSPKGDSISVSEEEDFVSSSEDESDFGESVSGGSGSDDESDIEETAPEDAEEQAGTATALEGTVSQTPQSSSTAETDIIGAVPAQQPSSARHIPQSGSKPLPDSRQWKHRLPLCLQLRPMQVLQTPTLVGNIW